MTYTTHAPAWRHPIMVGRQSVGGSSDAGTAVTIGRMCHIVTIAQDKPNVVQAATSLAQKGMSRYQLASAVWSYVHSKLIFKEDEQLLQELLGIVDVDELLIAPWELLAMDKPMGDCDDFSMLIAALLCVLGVECQFITIAADNADKERYSHVYVEATVDNGERLVLDASHGKHVGWEAPVWYKRTAWPILCSRQSIMSKGLSGYGVSPSAKEGMGDSVTTIDRQVIRGEPRRRTRNLGLLRITPNGIEDQTLHGAHRLRGMGATDWSNPDVTGDWGINPAPIGWDTPTYVPPVGSGWTSVFQQVLPGLFKTGERIAFMQGTPRGTQISQSPYGSSYSVSNNPFSTLPIGSGGGTSWLLIGGLAIGVLVLFRKGR